MNIVRRIIFPAVQCHSLVLKRCAGHSKWANIRHTKAANDSARSKLFNKFAQLIKVCIQEKGDGNPDTNRALAQIIESAKRQSMPAATIQNAIKVAQGSKSKCEECWFEIRGPKGCFIIVSTVTDNKKKTKDTIASVIKKNNASFADNITKMMFSQKAVIEVEPPDNVKDMDQVMDHAIESGAEDVIKTDLNSYVFYSDPLHLDKTKNKLESLNYKIIEAENHFLPNSPVTLTDSDLVTMEKLCDKLEELPDIVKLYNNIA